MLFRKKASAPPPFPLLKPISKKKPFPWLLFFIALFCLWFVWESLCPHLPTPNEPPRLYSNQCQQDIRSTLLAAIRKASSSIHLIMFGLSDRAILNALTQKIAQKVPTTIYYDSTGSPKIYSLLQGGDIHPIQNSGLMHQKVVVIDQEMVFIGSANMTPTSLRMHDNLVIGLVSPTIAQFIQTHKPFTPGYLQTKVGGQDIELWLLPDPRGHALTELRKKIRSARSTIRMALFTFTHPALIEEVIDAHERGVAVSLVIDMHTGLGASSKTLQKLKKANIPLLLSQGLQLLHHKFIYIDNQTLLTGSANWTKAAFYKNCDCIIALHHLTPDQKRFMNRLWRQIEINTKPLDK